MRVSIAKAAGAFAIFAAASVIASTTAYAVAPTAPTPTAYPATTGECFNYGLDAIRGVWQLPDTPVECSDEHTALTLYVGPSKSITTLPPAGKLSEEQQKAFRAKISGDSRTCQQALKKAVGPELELSRYGWNLLYQPGSGGTVDLRCDAILYSPNAKTLLPLPSTLMDTAPDYMRCVKLSGSSVAYVKCGRGAGIGVKHGMLNSSGNKPYPGLEKTRSKMANACRGTDLWVGNTSKEGWKAGGSYTCYIIQ